jgi:hypothetical protein
MKSFFVLAAAAAVLALALPGESFAQRGMGGGYGGKYDPQTVETVSGEVISVDKVAYGRRGYYGVHLLLKTDKGDLSVHLGPSWFVGRQTVKIAVHDAIEVTGSKVTYGGKPALIAAEIRKGGETLRLRTAEGLPLWRGGRMR